MRFTLCVLGVASLLSTRVEAQSAPPRPVRLSEARALAQRSSPTLVAARYALDAATGRARQAGAFPNPTISYVREETSQDGLANSQGIVQIEQPLDIMGRRSASRDAAERLVEATTARVAAATAQLDYEVAHRYGFALATMRRVTLADEAAEAFAEAARKSEARLAAGDASGYQHRRLVLEATRYRALRAAAHLSRDTAFAGLRSLLGLADSVERPLLLTDTLFPEAIRLSVDSLVLLALANQADLRVATLEAAAGAAALRAASAERIPVPTLFAGYKREQLSSGTSPDGYTAGISLPVPLWDRRAGALTAARADSARQDTEVASHRRRVTLDIRTSFAAHQALASVLELLRSQLGDAARSARQSADAGYLEGELSLLEWLDSVRAYYEAEVAFASLREEYFTRRAALERASGVPLF